MKRQNLVVPSQPNLFYSAQGGFMFWGRLRLLDKRKTPRITRIIIRRDLLNESSGVLQHDVELALQHLNHFTPMISADFRKEPEVLSPDCLIVTLDSEEAVQADNLGLNVCLLRVQPPEILKGLMYLCGLFQSIRPNIAA